MPKEIFQPVKPLEKTKKQLDLYLRMRSLLEDIDTHQEKRYVLEGILKGIYGVSTIETELYDRVSSLEVRLDNIVERFNLIEAKYTSRDVSKTLPLCCMGCGRMVGDIHTEDCFIGPGVIKYENKDNFYRWTTANKFGLGKLV